MSTEAAMPNNVLDLRVADSYIVSQRGTNIICIYVNII